MPFAELPGSHIQGLQVPDWTRFAAQANDYIAHQPVPDYSEIVKDAVGQIDEIVKMASPEGRLERALKREQLGAMLQTYHDYRQHPENFMLTAHGPVRRDPLEALLKGAHFKQAITAARLNEAKLKNEEGAGSVNDFLGGLRAKATSFFGRSDIPLKTPSEPATVVPGQSQEVPTQSTDEVPETVPEETPEETQLFDQGST